MLSDDRVIIKGVRDGLLILLDDSTPWPDLVTDLDSRVTARRAFFSGATVTVNLGNRIIDEPEFHGLHDLLTGFDMTLDVIVSTSTQTRAVAGANGVRNRAPAFGGRVPDAGPASPPPARPRRAPRPVPPAAAAAAAAAPIAAVPRTPDGEPDFTALADEADGAAAPPAQEMRWTPEGEPDFIALAGEDDNAVADPVWAAGAPAALFVRRTLRSGMSIHHDGDVCILGDVNAGAEIVAGGDVVIWGALRGMIHAGAGGDTAAVVCALLLAPTQLRLADVVSRGSAPAGPLAPEMARIVHGRILVEPWSGPVRGRGKGPG